MLDVSIISVGFRTGFGINVSNLFVSNLNSTLSTRHFPTTGKRQFLWHKVWHWKQNSCILIVCLVNRRCARTYSLCVVGDPSAYTFGYADNFLQKQGKVVWDTLTTQKISANFLLACFRICAMESYLQFCCLQWAAINLHESFEHMWLDNFPPVVTKYIPCYLIEFNCFVGLKKKTYTAFFHWHYVSIKNTQVQSFLFVESK